MSEINNPYPTYEEALERGCSHERSNQLHDLRIAFAQGSLAVLKWLEEPDSDHTGIAGYYLHRKDCPICWASLIGEKC